MFLYVEVDAEQYLDKIDKTSTLMTTHECLATCRSHYFACFGGCYGREETIDMVVRNHHNGRERQSHISMYCNVYIMHMSSYKYDLCMSI